MEPGPAQRSCGRVSAARHVQLSMTRGQQDPLSMGFPRHECWSGLPVPVPIKMMVRPYQPTDKPNEMGKETERAEALRDQEDEQK